MKPKTLMDVLGPCEDAPELICLERQRCEIWTRIMGYCRPLSAWNPGKQQEHKDRKFFREPSRG